MKKAFTLIELIFVIVIIGVLGAVAVPKFSKLTDNAKISAELATAASVQSAIEAVHAEWITNRCTFQWGPRNIDSNDTTEGLSVEGYPKQLGSKLDNILSSVKKWNCSDTGASGASCTGPASGTKGTSHCKTNKPCNTKHWVYYDNNGSFELVND